MSINTLPDEILLEVFDFCEDEDRYPLKEEIEVWVPLVHVCHRWRSIIFASPRRLNLQLVWVNKTPARDTLDVWPALPLLIMGYWGQTCPTEDMDNGLAVLERSDRVCQIELTLSSSLLEKALASMLVPFPELTVLEFELEYEDESMPVLPDSFLGGSAPSLQLFSLNHISFPGLPKLLLSATHLVELSLWRIYHSGSMSSEAMATILSTLTSLEEFTLGFQSWPRFDQPEAGRRPPLLTRSVLPALKTFFFKGVSEYLEDLVARLDAPQLEYLDITFFNRVVLNTRQFIQFICRTPMMKAPERAYVVLEDKAVMAHLTSRYGEFLVKILCGGLDWRPLSLLKVCTLCLPPLSKLEDLHIEPTSPLYWLDDIENTQWLEALHPFAAAKNLYLDEESAQCIVPALQERVGGGTTEVLPTLQNIIFKGPKPSGSIQEAIGQFGAVRQVSTISSRPIAVIHRPYVL